MKSQKSYHVHRKLEFVTVNQNSLNYGGGKIVFHRSVVKPWFVFRNPHCPNLKTALYRLQLRIMSGPVRSGPAGIRLQSVLSGYPAVRKISCPVHLYLEVPLYKLTDWKVSILCTHCSEFREIVSIFRPFCLVLDIIPLLF